MRVIGRGLSRPLGVVLAAAAVVLLGAPGPSGTAAAPLDKVRERGVLEVAVYKDFPPFAFVEEGRAVGIDIDVANALAERLGVGAAIRLVGADENMEDDLRNNVWKGHYLGGGVADVMLHVPLDATFARREDMVSFVAPYYREQLVLAADPARVPADASVEVFKREKVGVELDTLADFHLLGTLGGILSRNVVHYRSVADAMEALVAGEIAAVFGPSSEVEAGLGDARERFSIQPLTVPGRSRMHWDLGAAVRFNHEALSAGVNEAMAELRVDGTLERIFAAHGITYRPPSAGALALTGN